MNMDILHNFFFNTFTGSERGKCCFKAYIDKIFGIYFCEQRQKCHYLIYKKNVTFFGKMSRESLRDEPVLDNEIVDQNYELMDEKFPDELMGEWYSSIVPLIHEVIDNFDKMTDIEAYEKAHKCAGSALQIGANQLGQALRTVSHLRKAGNMSTAKEIMEDVPGYLDTFQKAVDETKQ